MADDRWPRRRVWLALLGAPLVLGAAFAPVVGYLVAIGGVSPDALVKAIEPIAVFPATLGFAAIFFGTRALARRDGLSLEQLGWSRPAPADLAIGAFAGAGLHALNVLALHPLLRVAQPSFDPTASAVVLPAVLLMLTVGSAAEDTLYRGYAFHQLRQRHGLAVAFLVTSFFYAILAPGPELPLKLWAAGFGLVLCGLRQWRQNLWPVVIAHAVVVLGPRLWLTLVG